MTIRKTGSALLFAVLMTVSAYSQPSETVYLGDVVKAGFADNVTYGPFNIGFNFTFFGNSYNQFHVNTNGMITFGTGSFSFTPAAIPSATLPNNFIAPFWDDLRIDPFGNILYRTIGTAPNRKMVVQFRNMVFSGLPPYMGTFQVILYESSNIIQTQYRLIILPNNDRATGGLATIGIENSDGTAGVQYSYQTSGAVSDWKAIRYTPDGLGSYTVNDGALYDGIYLTTNLSQPEPGLLELISPPVSGITGVSHLFQWGPSEYATNYSLRISTDPTLYLATAYNAGTNLSYTVDGLEPGQTYYWTVFSSNSTGTTWNKVRSFTVSSTPPLAGVPRTVWVEQGAETIGTIQYTGGDGSTVTATVTSLPAEGKLYQVSGGVKGDLITTVPTLVTDPGLQLIYLADGSSGSGVGNFSFFVTDDTGDSPEETITINVSPPGIPNVLYVARSTGVEIQFDRRMNNPAGKENQFTVTVDGSPVTVTTAGLKTGDQFTIVLALSTPLTGSETVTVAYTQGDVTATTGGVLLSFDPAPVTLLSQNINFPEITPKKYGDPDYNPGATAPGGAITYSSSNLAVATIVTNRVRFTGVGASVITARQAGNATYAPARYERPLTVNKGDQVITFDPLPDKTYGDPSFTISATVNSGLTVTFSSSNTNIATVSGNTVTIHNAGSTVITGSQAGSTLWNPAPDVPQTLTVSKVVLTLTADDKTKEYLAPIPVLTYQIAGFITGEDASVVDNLPAIQTTATASSDVGTYPISFTGGSDNNYSFSFVNGELTITQIGQTITFGTLPVSVVMGTPLTINATSTSGLTILFESLSPAIATITGNELTGIARGTANIRAYHPGNINYLPAEAFASVEIITTHRDILYLFTPNNDGFNDLWEIPNLAALGSCDVRVFNRWGKLVYANKNYNNDWDGTSEGKPLPEGAYVFIIDSENQGVIKGTVNIVR